LENEAKQQTQAKIDRFPAKGLAMRIPWLLVRQILLTLCAIYLIGGAIMFNVQLLQTFDCATPTTVGGTALLIAFLAKLIVREEF
jgi:hypothetical protein